MNRKTIKFTYRIAAALLLASIFTFAFVRTRSSASEQGDKGVQNQKASVASKTNAESKTTASDDAPESAALKAEKRGFPLLNLRDGKKFQTKYVGENGVEQSLGAAQAQPLTMTNADLNADGAADLVVGYADGSGGGHLVFHKGSLDTLSARTPEIFEGMKEGRFPAPFLPKASLIQLPVAPDFVGTGDFNRDGSKDIIAAQRGDNKTYLLLGDNKNSFKSSYIELPGRVTAMLADNIDPLDNAADIAFAVTGENGASLIVYKGSADAFGDTPEIYSLPAEATSLAIGQLDDSEPMDILAAVGGKIAIIHGSYPDNESSKAGQVEILNPGFDAAAARVGNFVWDRESLPEIALLSSNGSVHILERGDLDKRMFSDAEWKTRWQRHREEAMAQDAVRRLDYQPQQSKNVRQKWSEADSFQIAAPLDANRAASSAAFFTSARMTTLGVEDLLVIDSASRKLHVLVSNNEDLKKSGESYALSASGERAAVTLETEGSPVAALPMRLSVMNRPGIVLLNAESSEISYALAAPAATFTVTKTADTYDGTCNADCSLREALQAANAANSSDIIMVPALGGPYTISPALGGPDQDTTIDPAAQQSGDWDVFYDTTITGAGQATTILQAAAAQPGHDRVLDAIQTAVGIPDLTISGITIQNGRCQAGCVDGGGLRFAVDALAALTINDTTVTNNRTEVTTASPANNGGGIFGGQADYFFTNVTVTNNIAGFAVGGCTNCGSEGGGAIIAFTNTANPTSLTITNSTFTGNDARTATSFGGRGGALALSPNSVLITGGTFSNNIAGIDGGAFRIFTATTISGATINMNSAKQSGGGIWNDPLDNANNPLTNTFSNLAMIGNVADSNNATVASGGEVTRGDGGAIYHNRGTLNINNSNIGFIGQTANTAFNGGGIGHSYAQNLSAAFNASTININGGSIVGNDAINNGGGVLNDATRSAGGSATTLNIGATTAVTFTNNNARNNGGGIAVITSSGPTPAASATLINMTLRSNRANSDSSGSGDGGALHQDLGTVSGGGTTFTGTLTIGGSGFANSAVNGGGIRNNAGTVTFPSNVSITHNTATATGGGISNVGTLSALASATITNNTATGNGGGIYNQGTLGAITSPQLNLNSAATGGGIFSSNGALSITNGSVSTNTATTGKGGGIEHSGTSASLINVVTISSNTGSGVHITGSGSLDVLSNTITGNSGDGITKIGTGLGSHFNGNVIHTNGELGIDLLDNGVTPNDPNDADTGPNNLQNFPVINYVRRGDGVANVTLNGPNGSYRIEYFANTTCDASGHGEGEVRFNNTQVVTITTGNTVTFFSPALVFGTREQITAISTHDVNNNGNFDDDGNTSEFSACRKVNTLPTIAAQAGVSRQQGSPVSNSQIATVTDPDQTLNTLVVTVNGGAAATVNGVTLSNIVVSAGGFVTADIVASCSATTPATFTLRVTDNATEFNEANLTVTVTPNAAPTVGNYTNTTVNAGSSGTVITPDAAPADNGSISTVTAVAAPAGFTGTFVGNTTTGAITVNNANAVGIYTVTVTVTDNCGSTVQKTFTLTVNAIPTIAAQAGVTRQQGSPATNSQIAMVSDADQLEETLVVTIRAVGAVAPGTGTATVNGVTVSNIAVNAAGVVTADVVAACAATNAAFTLRVTDSNGAFNEATLNVAVTANTAPTVGTYATTNLTSGGGTTVTPTAAPADNGSISTATAAAPGFTGTLTVDSTTGVVTIANANPGGTYTVTVTFTDNCGTPTTRQFTLTVSYTISGTVIYGTTPSGDPAKFVPGVTLNAAGTPPASTTTATNGTYTLSGLGSGPYTVTPSKPTQAPPDNNGISFQDASEVAKYVFNLRTFTSNQILAADATGNGTVSLQDASEIAKRTANIPSTNNVGQWKFVPPSRTYPSISANLTGENYDAILVGDVTGNWTPPANRPEAETTEAEKQSDETTQPTAEAEAEGERGETGSTFSEQLSGLSNPATVSSAEMKNAGGGTVSVSLPNASGSAGTTVLIPVTVDNLTGENVTAYDFTVEFDPLILQPASPAFETAGTLTAAAGGYTVFVDPSQPSNRLRVGAFGTVPLSGQGTLIFLRFTVLAGAAATSRLDFVNFTFGEGTPADVTTNGSFMRLGPTAASVTIGGRVLQRNGNGVRNAQVEMTDQSGTVRMARTNSFGYYQITGVSAGESYVISIRHKQYVFAPEVLLINGDREDLNFVASP